MTDPADKTTKLEVPFSQIVGRYHESAALTVWYAVIPTLDESDDMVNDQSTLFARTIASNEQARAYSTQHNTQIDRAGGRTWYWGSDRFDQLGYAENADDDCMMEM